MLLQQPDIRQLSHQTDLDDVIPSSVSLTKQRNLRNLALPLSILPKLTSFRLAPFDDWEHSLSPDSFCCSLRPLRLQPYQIDCRNAPSTKGCLAEWFLLLPN